LVDRRSISLTKASERKQKCGGMEELQQVMKRWESRLPAGVLFKPGGSPTWVGMHARAQYCSISPMFGELVSCFAWFMITTLATCRFWQVLFCQLGTHILKAEIS
jgi:hypothetical protein